MNEKQEGFFKRIGKANTYVVLNTFFAYFAQGTAVIMLGAVLPALKSYYNISYSVGGMLLSVMFISYALFGLLAGYLPLKIGMKKSFILLTAPLAIGLAMLLVSGNPLWLLAAMFIIGINKGAVTTYNNQIVTVLSGGDAGPLNLLHAAFATGACIAPIIVLLCLRVDTTGWKLPIIIAIVVAVAGLIFMLPMKLDNSMYEKTESKAKEKASFGFFAEKLFIVSLIIAFLYQFLEGAVMSWITSYFLDSGVMTDSSAQLVTSALWISLLAGRTSCSVISRKMQTKHMLLLMTILQVIFSIMLVTSHSMVTMMIATVGLGLGMSGMYGTTVSNAGDVFSRYPTCMGYYVLISSCGAVLSPTLVGFMASAVNMRMGFVMLSCSAVALLLLSFYNMKIKK